MKSQVVLVHYKKDGQGEISVSGAEVEVVVMDDRGQRRELSRLVCKQMTRGEVVKEMGDGFWAGEQGNLTV